MERLLTHFKERIPDLARGLLEKITDAHKNNAKFKAAFGDFYELCQTALNPNIRREAVDEMLVQHLLTERLFRKIFNNPEFTRRNVIAAEIERVIDALVSKSFDRDDFLKNLDRFYRAIEDAARNIEDFTEKQHFLNTVYERFFQGYAVKVADTHGIVYTPQAVVDFMCESVTEVLKDEFGLSLGSLGVNILDPCTGTGNFIVNLLRRISPRDLPRAYREQLFANEVMLLPYYIASLNIEHEFYELTGTYEPFEGLCFVDTLELAEAEQAELSFMSEENTARVKRQKKVPITVVIGNPPYNVGQLNENDNNKNRNYRIVEDHISKTYVKESTATNRNALSDVYVKFFRWAVERLKGRDGIVCYVSNNSFVDQLAFDGMRKCLLQDFTRIYHLDLHGNVRRNPKLSGTTHNVFGIQVGVGITVAVRSSKHSTNKLLYHRVPETWRKEEKLGWLSQRERIGNIKWTHLRPDKHNTWLIPKHGDEFAEYCPIASKGAKAAFGMDGEAVFKVYCNGVKTNRDDVVYDFDREVLTSRVKKFIEDYNIEVFRFHHSGGNIDVDEFVDYEKLKWSRDLKKDLVRGRNGEFLPSKIRLSLYRPFCKKLLFFDSILNQDIVRWPNFMPTLESEAENRVIWLKVGADWPMFVMMGNCILDLLPQGGSQCFPFYVYEEDGTNRRENVTDWALEKFCSMYADSGINKWQIFYFVYAVLHLPSYREKFADNLKRDLPRIPYMADFHAFAKAGEQLADLHLNYEQAEPWSLRWIHADGKPLSYRVDDKMRLSKDKATLVVNESLSLGDIPPEAFSYRLGNRSALEWVIDQYQVSEDKRSGIKTDPNREADPEYIVRLVGQVVRVSVETNRIVNGLGEHNVIRS